MNRREKGERKCRNGAEPRKARRPASNPDPSDLAKPRRNGAEPRKARRQLEDARAALVVNTPQWGRASEGSETVCLLSAHAVSSSRNGAEPRKARRLTKSTRGGSMIWQRRNGAEPRKARRLCSEHRPGRSKMPQWGRASEGSETLQQLKPGGPKEFPPQWGRASEGSETC